MSYDGLDVNESESEDDDAMDIDSDVGDEETRNKPVSLIYS